VDDSDSFRRGGAPERGHVARPRQQADGPSAGSDLSAGALFTILWRALADILGTAAAATLLRRAAQRAAPDWPELAGLIITRDRLEYSYSLPPKWQMPSPGPPQALRQLARELCTLLVDLTGSVIVTRLALIPELSSRGIVTQLEVPQ